MKANIKAHLALILVNVIYGCNYLVVKEIIPQWMPAISLVVLRAIGAFLLFGFVYFLFSREKIDLKDLPRFIVCALTGVTINMALFIKGLSLTSPINASLIMITAPILVLIFSAILLKQKLGKNNVAGILLGAVGAFVLIYFTSTSDKVANVWGDLLVFINAASYALYLVLVKPLLSKYKPITVMFIVFGIGMFVLSLFGGSDLLNTNFSSIPINIWMAIGYVVVMVTFLTYMLNIFALSKVSPGIVGGYIYTQPVIASLLSVGLGKYPLEAIHFFAAALIFSGVYINSLKVKNE